MILVCALFVITWMPNAVYYDMIWNFNSNLQNDGLIYGVTFIAFLYICANPFIYAIKFDPV